MSDALFAKVKRLANERGTTMREMVEEGLNLVLEKRPRRARFRLRDASFGSGGLAPGVDETDWDKIRELTYEGRGG
jgi:hypothetical protein